MKAHPWDPTGTFGLAYELFMNRYGQLMTSVLLYRCSQGMRIFYIYSPSMTVGCKQVNEHIYMLTNCADVRVGVKRSRPSMGLGQTLFLKA